MTTAAATAEAMIVAGDHDDNNDNDDKKKENSSSSSSSSDSIKRARLSSLTINDAKNNIVDDGAATIDNDDNKYDDNNNSSNNVFNNLKLWLQNCNDSAYVHPRIAFDSDNRTMYINANERQQQQKSQLNSYSNDKNNNGTSEKKNGDSNDDDDNDNNNVVNDKEVDSTDKNAKNSNDDDSVIIKKGTVLLKLPSCALLTVDRVRELVIDRLNYATTLRIAMDNAAIALRRKMDIDEAAAVAAVTGAGVSAIGINTATISITDPNNKNDDADNKLEYTDGTNNEEATTCWVDYILQYDNTTRTMTDNDDMQQCFNNSYIIPNRTAYWLGFLPYRIQILFFHRILKVCQVIAVSHSMHYRDVGIILQRRCLGLTTVMVVMKTWYYKNFWVDHHSFHEYCNNVKV